jgi:putative ABC transport system ATP-binding protein
MVSVSNVSYSYRGGHSITFPNLTIQTGDQFLLLGESGSGKTTLLHLLGGLLKNQQGTIEVNGTSITNLSESELDRFSRKALWIYFST